MNYVNSNISWLGIIPEEWNIKKLKYLCYINTGSKDTQDKTDDGIFPFFVRSPIIERLNEYTYDEEAVMTAGDGVGVGKVFHHFNGKFAAHQRVYVFTKFKGVLGKYIYYYLKANLGFEVLGGGAKSTVDSLRRPMLSEFAVTVPTIKEQKLIINYLDYQTSEINKLIDYKEQMIHLLKEKRQTMITEAVTKGLKPNVKMKVSGVKSIGEIPEHWDYKRLNHIANLRRGPFGGALKIDSFVPSGFAIYEQQHAIHKDLESIRYFISSEKYNELIAFAVKPRDILLSCSGTIGQSVVIPKDFKEGIINQALLRIRINYESLLLDYFKFYMDSNLFQTMVTDNSHGSAMKNIASMSIINKTPICLPPMDEQRLIVEFLKEKLSSIDVLITDLKQQIQKLKDYRQSLIYEAVTGKIDVRDFERVQ